jgi:Endonuclease/Exonuclease/phosphatase family
VLLNACTDQMKKHLGLLFILFTVNAISQDSLRIMYHNLLNFPSSNPGRTSDFRTVLQYSKPDVYVVNELESEVGADMILDSSLNVFGVSSYARADFVDGIDTDNCLFYNSDKLGMISQFQLQTVLRDVSIYRLYYKSPNLMGLTDTIYTWFISCHLKAGQADFEQRNQEAQQIKFYLNDISNQAENVFVGGDFNFYSGFESGCQTLLNTGSIPLIDPVNAIGNWSNDFAYVNWHTQSTRLGSVNGGSSGGLDDRFDLIFVSEDVLDNQNGVQFTMGSYTPLGQDGNHFNNSVNSGTNNSVPDSVLQALYWGSDHLPVMMNVVLDETASTPQEDISYLQVYYSSLDHSLNFTTSETGFDIILCDLLGRVIFTSEGVTDKVNLPTHLEGIYIWSLSSNGQSYSNRIAIH